MKVKEEEEEEEDVEEGFMDDEKKCIAAISKQEDEEVAEMKNLILISEVRDIELVSRFDEEMIKDELILENFKELKNDGGMVIELIYHFFVILIFWTRENLQIKM